MKIIPATIDDQDELLVMMHESAIHEAEDSPDEWPKTKKAIRQLLADPQAGEAYLAYDISGVLIGYIILCRGFSLDYGGYFTWVEETYMRQAKQRRFRDQRFSP
jgi:hypothetical protein